MKKALITGVTGQDGSYLAELLVAKGYAVHGIVRRVSQFNRSRVDELRDAAEAKAGRFTLHYGDLQDAGSFRRVVREVRPDEIYHFAGQSHVGLSFEIPEVTCQENAMATLSLLECVREFDGRVRLYNACSSEVFGRPVQYPQDETTALNPVNPYGAAKAFALQMGRIYREAYGLFVVNGISYNHESPRRGENFITRKLAMAAVEIGAGRRSQVSVGNLDASRDWGYAPEFVEGMWRAMQAERADDYIFATGTRTTVREFALAAFAEAGAPIAFEGVGSAEVARRTDTGAVVLTIDARYFRPLEPGSLVGDAGRAAERLGWKASIAGAKVARVLVRAENACMERRACS